MDHLPPPLQYEVREGLNQNVFYQSATQACAAVVTMDTRPRILLTFPAGNSGLGLWADAKFPDNKALHMEAVGPLTEVDGNVRLTVHTNQSRLAFTQVELDSIRVIRNLGDADEAVPGQLRSKLAALLHAPASWARPVVTQDASTVTFQRTELNGSPWTLRVSVPPGVRIDWTDHAISPAGHLEAPLVLLNPAGGKIEFTLEGRVPFVPLTPHRAADLLTPQALSLTRAQADNTRYRNAVRDLEMLAYREKYLAGSWRFETYFGRDTLLSLSMLSNTLSTTAFEEGLDSVLFRLSPEGVVAHEEDVGDWAEIRELAAMDEGEPAPTAWETPQYDYKMVDSDFLLPLAEGELSPARLRRLLHSSQQTAVLCNWNRVLAQASYDLVRLNPALSVGMWRDSYLGLAGGVYAGDVNVTLVPCALRVIDTALRAGGMTPGDVEAVARREGFGALLAAVQTSDGVLHAMRRHWADVRHRFEVRLTAAEVRRRVTAYLGSLPAEEQHALGSQKILGGGPTVAEFLQGAPVPHWDGHLRFWALSLTGDQQPVAVLNSDTSFRLFFGSPPSDELSDIVTATRLPFPLGLMTDVGMVVSNPAYSSSTQLWKNLNADAYHGTVIWGWQHNMMALGLMRQIARFQHDPQQQTLVASMRSLLQDLQSAEDRAGPLVSSELWTWEVKEGHVVPLAFGVRQSSEDESNALQLWSAAWAGVYVARHQATPTSR